MSDPGAAQIGRLHVRVIQQEVHRHTQSRGEVLNHGVLRGLFAFGAGDRDFFVLIFWWYRRSRQLLVKADCDV
ncbi:MAG: hypothetical protein WB586_19255 [Chthoniobacterales bacterium]